MPTVTKRTETKPTQQVRFLGFSGSLMIFSDSPLITKSSLSTKENQQEPGKILNPKS
jgi:hypothetical protein